VAVRRLLTLAVVVLALSARTYATISQRVTLSFLVEPAP
jgi:hypothetical protein